MSMIESLLLLNTENIDIKNKTSSKNENFLLSLLENFQNEPDKLTDILKNLNFTQEDIDAIINKSDNTEIKDLLEKTKELLNSQQTQSKETLKKEDSLLSEILKEIPKENKTKKTKTEKEPPKEEKITQLFENKIELPKQNEEKIVSVTKKIIESHTKLNNIKFTQKEEKEFKEIKSIKELVSFANKKGLNIKKIVLDKKSAQTTQSFQNTENIEHKPLIILPNKKIEVQKKEIKKTDDIKKEEPIVINGIKIDKPKKDTDKKIKTSNVLSKLINNTNKDKNKKTIINPPQTDLKHQTQNTKKDKTSTINLSSQTIIDQLKQNITKAKESIKHFANNLNDAIQNYKPPVSKLSLEMHPKELGKVEVTLIHRGNNLQIQINSNNNAVNFLHSTQNELRQNLINMGYSDVNMSFNSNQQQGQKKYQQNQKFSNSSQEENDELIIEIPYQYA